MSIIQHLRDYETFARQHLFSNQIAEFFVKSLAGSSGTFILDSYRPGMSYTVVACMIRAEYDNDSRQLHVQSQLEGLKLELFIAERSLSTSSEMLKKIVDLIERLTPQCSVEFWSEQNKTR